MAICTPISQKGSTSKLIFRVDEEFVEKLLKGIDDRGFGAVEDEQKEKAILEQVEQLEARCRTLESIRERCGRMPISR